MNVVFHGERPKASLFRAIARFILFIGCVGGVVGGVVGLVAYGTFAKEIPNFDSMADYRPKLVSQVFDHSGRVIGEFYNERRIVLPYDDIPPKMVQAFLASEDDRFFEHEGIDYLGILRAAFANLRAGRVVQGGSTITQQVAKSLIISAEGYKSGSAKKLSRKLKEAILARRLEKKLSKEDILALYLNQIFLGNQAYGVQSAAQNYFRKNVDEMNIAEMALLAGLPQAPSRYSPFRYPKRAKKRREYVLNRMVKEGFVTQLEANEARETPIVVYPAANVSKETTPYYTEHVRKLLLGKGKRRFCKNIQGTESKYAKNPPPDDSVQLKFSNKQLLEQGLKIYTAVDLDKYRTAENAAYRTLRMVDKRQGYRGPLMELKTEAERENFTNLYKQELKALGRYNKLKEGEFYVGVIDSIDRGRTNMTLQIGPHKALLPISAMRWARKVDPQVWFERGLRTTIPKTFKKGQVLMVRKTTLEEIKKDRYATSLLKKLPKDKLKNIVALEQAPSLEGALLSVHRRSGYVQAMIGGYSFERSEFNRSLQACRQPGSSFKPLVYTSALDLEKWTPSTIVLDAPITSNDASAGLRWKPSNFSGKFIGEVTLRTALQNSMNVPAIKVLNAVGIGPAIRYAERLGIRSELRPELGMALGASAVTMSELVDVYMLFSNYGKKIKKRFITRIVDRDGKVLYDNGYYADPWSGMDLKVDRALAWSDEPPEQVIDREIGFIGTKMMRNVVLGGTGTGAQRVGVPVAGKTGTTNDSFDAWFMGFTTEIVTAAWVGYDDYVIPMGRYEQGGRAALPLWVSYMKGSMTQRTGEFQPPPGVVFVRIDPKTGKRARPGTIGAVREAFRRGTEPKEFVAKAGEIRSDEFFYNDN